jgi:hypothetical protein
MNVPLPPKFDIGQTNTQLRGCQILAPGFSVSAQTVRIQLFETAVIPKTGEKHTTAGGLPSAVQTGRRHFSL